MRVHSQGLPQGRPGAHGGSAARGNRVLCPRKPYKPGTDMDGPARKTKVATGARCFGYDGVFVHEVLWKDVDGSLLVDDQDAFNTWLQQQLVMNPTWTAKEAVESVLAPIFCSDTGWAAKNEQNKQTNGWKFTKVRYSYNAIAEVQ